VAVERRFPPWMPKGRSSINFCRPFSISNPLSGCNSGKALLTELTRIFSKQQRSSTSTNAKRLVSYAGREPIPTKVSSRA
jgi:hypothetical protein